MEKLDPKKDGATPDIVEQNVEQLKELFPEIVTAASSPCGKRSSATLNTQWPEGFVVDAVI